MPIVLNELLGRDLIKIYQDSDGFSFSLDSVLLADFVTISPNCRSICDLCSGNAPIPLYLTLRTKAKITGIEIQEHSYALANMSIEENKLENQIDMINTNLIGINEKINKFDVVTCNPPFFKIGTSIINPSDKKAIARHELFATLDDIVKEASLLLKSKGRFAMVHRPDRLVEILDTFRKYKIEPKRLRFVYPRNNKDCNHILIEGIKDGLPGSLIVESPLFVYGEDNKWTKEVLEIYNYEKR